MKKYIIIGIMILILITGLVSCKGLKKSNKEKTIESKIELLQSKLRKIDSNNEVNLILSISNGKERAKVIIEKSNSLDEAVNKIKNKAVDFVKTNNYNTKWTKLEIIDSEEEVYIDEFENIELPSVQNGSYRKGMIIPEDQEIILTEAELNSNGIIDYQNQRIDLNKLNEYTKNENRKKVESIPSKIKVFSTIGYFCDEDNNIFEISNNDWDKGRRIIETVNKEETTKIINNSSDYLEKMLKDNGEFQYGYNPITDKDSEDYNILRHAGSTWALLICKENLNKDRIDKAIDFMNQSIIDKDEQTSYIIEKKSNEIKLGGNALAIIALCEYTDKYKDTKYVETIRKLANGIISMQKENGGYSHILNTNDFSIEDEYRTVYYDGEATLALLKAYKLLNDEKIFRTC